MSLLRSASTVGGFTLLSRLFGFVRDILMAQYLGSGNIIADAFIAAFRWANLFRTLFSEGALNAAFIPLYSRERQEKGEAAAIRFASHVLMIQLLILIPLTIFIELIMPTFVSILAPGFTKDPEKLELAITFTRICFPYLMLMVVAGLLSSLLNSIHQFAVAAATPILLNIVMITGLMIGQSLFPTIGHALSWSVFAAGLVQVAWLLWNCRHHKVLPFFIRPRLTAKVKRFLKLMVPGIVGASVNQINLVIGTMFATTLPGAVSNLYYADRVNQLPLGIIGVGMGIALLPFLAQQIRDGDETKIQSTQTQAINFSMLITIPAAIGLCVLAYPIIDILFQRGKFTPEDSKAASAALMAYALGLPSYVLVKVLIPSFFAREDTATPVKIAGLSTVVNIILIPILMSLFKPELQLVGIALAGSLSGWLNASLLAWLMIRRRHYLVTSDLVYTLIRIVIAAAVMGISVYFLGQLLSPWLHNDHSLLRIFALGILLGMGGIIFFLTAEILGVKVRDYLSFLRRRGRKNKDDVAVSNLSNEP